MVLAGRGATTEAEMPNENGTGEIERKGKGRSWKRDTANFGIF